MARTRGFDSDQTLEKVMITFWQNGFDQTGVRELTAASGVKPQSLYNAYGRKEGLFAHALKHYLTVAEHAADAVVTSEQTAPEKLVQLLILDWGSLPYPNGCMIISAMSEFEKINPNLSDLAQQLFDYLTNRFVQILQMMPNQLRTDLDVQDIAQTLLTVHNGLQISARNGAPMSELQAIAHTTVQAILKEEAK
ncbi:TetR/AcrR family transcriptional regulator [Lacticaseibacillus pabuli]|uniref:TetR/AcrR family transcriptional regulator n=1 Tax=Lacticaseibacillus pabuli TaxID=3025672 RepID=A0ABY7WSW6_9LACO|nr:TetR/AcrR family transcriptional regulator [Lacticaseibacillus sp. KACC 23028]WDF82119.1 TetR/AcrR family transcriptional regulator [Lacticaseibacillus sp. KACC 23028]